MECVADQNLEIRTVQQPCLDLSEESFARLDPEEDIETTSRVIVPIAVDQHESGSTTGVEVPRFRVGERIGELEVEARDGEVVADSELDVRSEADVIDEWLGLEVPADHKLIGIDGRADPYSECLRSNGWCGQAEECGEGTQAQQYSAI